MIGKANEIKTLLVNSHYVYPKGDYSVSNRKWVTLDEAINTALAGLGNAEIISISHTSQAFGEDDSNETALIIYRSA